MYDGGSDLGRNDKCWCGSGKKYKSCHIDFDKRLEELYLDGFTVPPRSLIKSASDIEGIKESAAINIGALDYVAENIGPGCTTADIDKWVYDYTVTHDAVPAPLNYEGYPKSCCTSVNDCICHGIPSMDEVLRDGDIVNVDCSTIKDGYYSDSSRMFMIGGVSDEAKKLVTTTKESIQVGLDQVRGWFNLYDMSAAVQKFVENSGFSVVREYGGHGIGFEFHEDPWVPHVGMGNETYIMPPGMVFTIEPMVNAGKHKIKGPGRDGWRVVTKDGSLSAQWEVQVLVTENGYELLSW